MERQENKDQIKEGEVSEVKELLKARTECVCEHKNNT